MSVSDQVTLAQFNEFIAKSSLRSVREFSSSGNPVFWSCKLSVFRGETFITSFTSKFFPSKLMAETQAVGAVFNFVKTQTAQGFPADSLDVGILKSYASMQRSINEFHACVRTLSETDKNLTTENQRLRSIVASIPTDGIYSVVVFGWKVTVRFHSGTNNLELVGVEPNPGPCVTAWSTETIDMFREKFPGCDFRVSDRVAIVTTKIIAPDGLLYKYFSGSREDTLKFLRECPVFVSDEFSQLSNAIVTAVASSLEDLSASDVDHAIESGETLVVKPRTCDVCGSFVFEYCARGGEPLLAHYYDPETPTFCILDFSDAMDVDEVPPHEDWPPFSNEQRYQVLPVEAHEGEGNLELVGVEPNPGPAKKGGSTKVVKTVTVQQRKPSVPKKKRVVIKHYVKNPRHPAKSNNISHVSREYFKSNLMLGSTIINGKRVRNIAHAETVLKKYGFSPKEMDCLIQMIDPFHDLERPVGKAPFRGQALSVVRKVTKTLNIAAPPGTSSGTWQCYIVAVPASFSTNAKLNEDVLDNNFAYSGSSSAATNFPAGIVAISYHNNTNPEVNAWPAGATLPDTGNGRTINQLNWNEYAAGLHRVIGLGYEVHNTSAALNRQGTVGVFKQPLHQWPGWVVNDTPTPDVQIPVRFVLSPPATLSGASNYPTYHEWEAEKGAYVVCSMSEDSIPFQMMSNTFPVILGDDIQPASPGTPAAFVPQPDGSLAGTKQTFGCVHPYNIHGAYFSGLSGSTTLRLTMHAFIETLPSVREVEIYNIATPTARDNPVFWQVLDKVMNAMPAGVQVDENSLGDWFFRAMDILDAAGDASALVMEANPILGAAMKGAGMIGKTAKGIRRLYNRSK